MPMKTPKFKPKVGDKVQRSPQYWPGDKSVYVVKEVKELGCTILDEKMKEVYNPFTERMEPAKGYFYLFNELVPNGTQK